MISKYAGLERRLSWLPIALLIGVIAISAGCRTDEGDDLSVPVELAALDSLDSLDSLAQIEADVAEEEARRQAAEREEVMRLAELELEQREARLREEARLLEERQALVLEQERMAARQLKLARQECTQNGRRRSPQSLGREGPLTVPQPSDQRLIGRISGDSLSQDITARMLMNFEAIEQRHGRRRALGSSPTHNRTPTAYWAKPASPWRLHPSGPCWLRRA